MLFTFENKVRLVSDLRYALQHGCLAKNGQRIPFDDHATRNMVMDQIRAEVRRELLTVNQRVVFGGILWTGDVHGLCFGAGNSMMGTMSVLDGQVSLTVVRLGPDDEWACSSARVRYGAEERWQHEQVR